ncbi:efflux RND transporter periplasmic adaptor subunit [Micromonospora sp. NPDC050397]|uniref:efflux RND transporter periplasmic adaptor subunit n=1 Tax=Micromonospora sp. NPDC050397 TaxID=3364279 RepID=UPI00384D5DF0
MTTVKPTRQELANKVSLAGKVTIDPVFGLVSPVKGQVRYLDVRTPQSTPTKPTRVANVWVSGKAHRIEVPAGAVFTGRLVDDRSTVVEGMPVVSAKMVGYGLVAELDGAQAYQIADGLATVQAQIKNGPGPFPCTVLGTIAALPAGTIPDPPAAPPATPPSGAPPAGPIQQPPSERNTTEPSEPTGLRLVCTAPSTVKLINGASATLEVVTARAANALVLPVESVAGTQGQGKVDVVGPQGVRETRDVALGLSDGKVVEIKSGLTGTETVAVPGPNLPPAKPAEGDPNAPTVVK